MALDPDPKATAFLHASMPLCATLGMQAVEASPQRIVLTMDWKPELCTSNDMLHGGALMALADAGGGYCGFLNLPEGAAGTSTIESKTNFLAAVRGGTVTATSTPLHVGSTVMVIETEVRDERDRLVAKVTQSQAVLRPK